ncbi:unnamed protein product, partial [Prorocentrum cordatum]
PSKKSHGRSNMADGSEHVLRRMQPWPPVAILQAKRSWEGGGGGRGGRGGEIAGIGGNKKTAAPLDCKFWRQHSRKHESEVRAAKTGRALSNLDRRMMKEWNRCSGRKEDAEEVCRSQLPERLHAQQKKKVCMTIARRLPRRRTRLFQAARAASARRHASAKSRLRRGVHLFSYTDAY